MFNNDSTIKFGSKEECNIVKIYLPVKNNTNYDVYWADAAVLDPYSYVVAMLKKKGDTRYDTNKAILVQNNRDNTGTEYAGYENNIVKPHGTLSKIAWQTLQKKTILQANHDAEKIIDPKEAKDNALAQAVFQQYPFEYVFPNDATYPVAVKQKKKRRLLWQKTVRHNVKFQHDVIKQRRARRKNNYKARLLAHQIGSGAQGCVYDIQKTTYTGYKNATKAKHKVVKISVMPHLQELIEFSPELESDFIKRALQENAITIKALGAQPLVMLYDETKGIHFALITDYVPGKTLQEWLKIGLPTPIKFTIMQKLLQELQRIHTLGIVHRDLKPENIMVNITENGDINVKIIDYGLACYKRKNDFLIKGFVGTAAYMAPEQYQFKGSNTKSDLWALGLIFLEMLSDTPVDKLQAHQATCNRANCQFFTKPLCKSLKPKLFHDNDDAAIAEIKRLLQQVLNPEYRFRPQVAQVIKQFNAIIARGSRQENSRAKRAEDINKTIQQNILYQEFYQNIDHLKDEVINDMQQIQIVMDEICKKLRITNTLPNRLLAHADSGDIRMHFMAITTFAKQLDKKIQQHKPTFLQRILSGIGVYKKKVRNYAQLKRDYRHNIQQSLKFLQADEYMQCILADDIVQLKCNKIVDSDIRRALTALHDKYHKLSETSTQYHCNAGKIIQTTLATKQHSKFVKRIKPHVNDEQQHREKAVSPLVVYHIP